MAERHTAKVSRRRAVAALGASVVGGAVGIKGTAAQPYKQADGVTCGPMPAPRPDQKGVCKDRPDAVFVRKSSTNPGDQLQLETCCKYLSQALMYGFCDAHTETRGKLKTFITKLQDEIQRAALLDYCFVQFDLTESELEAVRSAVNARLAATKGRGSEKK